MGNSFRVRLFEDMASDCNAEEAPKIVQVDFTVTSNVFECRISLTGDMGSYFVPIDVLQAE